MGAGKQVSGESSSPALAGFEVGATDAPEEGAKGLIAVMG